MNKTANTSRKYGAAKLFAISILGIALGAMPINLNAQHKGKGKRLLNEADSLNYYYTQSVVNSAYTAPSKISHNLIPVTDSNKTIVSRKIGSDKYILVTTWKSNVTWYPPNADTLQPYNTGKYDLWVTVAPELKKKVQGVDSNHINTRLKQLLGLPPDAQYSYFVLFWVRPQDLFRPCADNEISDNSCSICFPANTDSTYINWINQQRIDRFFNCDTSARYPWTELGYTYDWNPKNSSHEGCSEFVIRKNSNIFMKHIYTTNEYIYGKNKQ